MGIFLKACGTWGSDWCSWQWWEKCLARGYLASESAANLFAVLARTLRRTQACPSLFWSRGDRLDVQERKFVPFQMGPQKLDHLSVFEESCGILVLAIAKEPQFLDLWYMSSVVHNPNSSPVCQPLVSLVWHLCTFVVVVLIFFCLFWGWVFYFFLLWRVLVCQWL